MTTLPIGGSRELMRLMTIMLIGLFTSGLSAQNTANTAPGAKAPGQQKPSEHASVLATPKNKRSYALGMDFGRQLRNNMIDVDPDTFAKGLKDALSGGSMLLTDDEARAAIADLQAEMKRRIAEGQKAGADENKKAGDAFLAENKKKDGVVNLPSGLQYKILKPGDGPKPTITDTVVCNYRGTLINGVEFDSSYKRGQPATFAVNRVIKGWTEALQLMPVGSKWQLVIPPELAYGERGAGTQIGPNATLVFEVELLSIQDKK